MLSTTWEIASSFPALASDWGSGVFTLNVHATDVSNNVQSPDTSVWFVVDQTQPSTTISNPAEGAFFNATTVIQNLSGASPNRIRGTATDDLSGVAGVSAKLVRFASGATQYWNGTAWVGTDPGYVLTPTLTPAGGNFVLSTTWEITNPPTLATDWGTSIYTVLVHATDVSSNVQAPDTQVQFTVDAVQPTTTITNPPNGTFYNAATVVSSLSSASPNRMRGTATDDLAGVQSVSGKLTRFASGTTTYWNGSAWVGSDPGYVLTPTLTPAGGAFVLSTTWEIASSFPALASDWGSGVFTLNVHATDMAANVQSPDTTAWFVVDQVAPSTTIQPPARHGNG